MTVYLWNFDGVFLK